MNCIILFASLILGASALPYELIEDEEGQQFYLIPQNRIKRQSSTSWNLQSPGIASVSHTGTIFDNNKHHLDGTGYASKNLRGGGIVPETYGGRLDYSHKPSQSVLGLQADHVHRGGTDLKATGTYNFIHRKNLDVGLSGQYGRHLGGPGGSSKPDYGVFVGGKYTF